MRRITLLGLLLLTAGFRTQAAYTSLYAFGDGVSTTTDNPSGITNYYGQRRCNGRVWIEVLAQWQGLGYDSNKNQSYYGHCSYVHFNNKPTLVDNTAAFTAGDAASSLFLIWVNNADFVAMVGDGNLQPRDSTKLPAWTATMNASLSNHLVSIQTLYSKGARTLVMPTAVDLTKVPYYFGLPAADKSFIRQRTLEYNLQFAATLSNAAAAMPGLTIYMPDIFPLLDQLTTNAASFGMTNPPGGSAIDILWDGMGNPTLDGTGASYVFWDYLHPSAKFQMLIAERAQQLISPVRIGGITGLGASNRLDLVNLPVGRNGFVDVSTDLMSWTNGVAVTSTNMAQSVFLPAPGTQGFHRVRLPFSWVWP